MGACESSWGIGWEKILLFCIGAPHLNSTSRKESGGPQPYNVSNWCVFPHCQTFFGLSPQSRLEPCGVLVCFLSIYVLLLTDSWLDCIRRELSYVLNRRYSAWTNDIWALGVVLITVVNRHTVLTTVIQSSQKDASQTNPWLGLRAEDSQMQR